MYFSSGEKVRRVVALHVVDRVVTLFWLSLGLRETSEKNIVHFPSGGQEQVGRVGYLLWGH